MASRAGRSPAGWRSGMSTPADLKKALRLRLRQDLARMPAATRAEESGRLCRTLMDQPFWQEAATLLAFVPTSLEPDIWEAIRLALDSGKEVCLPRFSRATGAYEPCLIRDGRTDLQPGQYGILEPGPGCPVVAWPRLGLILVPGMGFSLSGGRLGRGQGHYDRLLAATPDANVVSHLSSS